ncbi:MAG: hypothetical protein R6V11_01105, partial [Ectothiorhodospiraceae bacterium]
MVEQASSRTVEQVRTAKLARARPILLQIPETPLACDPLPFDVLRALSEAETARLINCSIRWGIPVAFMFANLDVCQAAVSSA